MGGLIRADLKKLFKSKSLYVCMVIAAILGVSMSLLYNYFWQERGQNIALWYALMDQYNMKTDVLDEALRQIPSQNLLSYINIFFSDGALWLIGSPCICAYCAAEFNSGTYKNTVSRGVSKTKLFFSKVIVSVIEMFMLSFLYVLAGTLAAVSHVDFETDLEAGRIVFLGVIYFLLIIASASVFVMLTILFRRSGFAVAAAIAAPMLIASLIQIASMANPELSELTGYVLMNTYVTVFTSVNDGGGLKELFTAIGYTAVSLLIGGIVFRKSEIR